MQIVDLVEGLPWHTTRRWNDRSISQIDQIIVHQELGEGTIEAVNNYHITPGRGNHISQKGTPHFCYHYGIRKNGEIVKANKHKHVTWHCRGQNTRSIGIMLVGNFKGTGHHLGSDGPTNEQIEATKKLVDHLVEELGLSRQSVYGHYHFGKPACPGYVMSEWVEKYRATVDGVLLFENPAYTVKGLQERLKALGYKVGTVNGIQGIKTKKAINSFQADNNLVVDGIAGPMTWRVLLERISNT